MQTWPAVTTVPRIVVVTPEPGIVFGLSFRLSSELTILQDVRFEDLLEPDLVVLDVTGQEFDPRYGSLLGRLAHHGVRVVFLADEALHLPPAAVIQRPFKLKELARTIRELLAEPLTVAGFADELAVRRPAVSVTNSPFAAALPAAPPGEGDQAADAPEDRGDTDLAPSADDAPEVIEAPSGSAVSAPAETDAPEEAHGPARTGDEAQRAHDGNGRGSRRRARGPGRWIHRRGPSTADEAPSVEDPIPAHGPDPVDEPAPNGEAVAFEDASLVEDGAIPVDEDVATDEHEHADASTPDTQPDRAVLDEADTDDTAEPVADPEIEDVPVSGEDVVATDQDEQADAPASDIQPDHDVVDRADTDDAEVGSAVDRPARDETDAEDEVATAEEPVPVSEPEEAVLEVVAPVRSDRAPTDEDTDLVVEEPDGADQERADDADARVEQQPDPVDADDSGDGDLAEEDAASGAEQAEAADGSGKDLDPTMEDVAPPALDEPTAGDHGSPGAGRPTVLGRWRRRHAATPPTVDPDGDAGVDGTAAPAEEAPLDPPLEPFAGASAVTPTDAADEPEPAPSAQEHLEGEVPEREEQAPRPAGPEEVDAGGPDPATDQDPDAASQRVSGLQRWLSRRQRTDAGDPRTSNDGEAPQGEPPARPDPAPGSAVGPRVSLPPPPPAPRLPPPPPPPPAASPVAEGQRAQQPPGVGQQTEPPDLQVIIDLDATAPVVSRPGEVPAQRPVTRTMPSSARSPFVDRARSRWGGRRRNSLTPPSDIHQRIATFVPATQDIERLVEDVPLVRSLPALLTAVLRSVAEELQADTAGLWRPSERGWVPVEHLGFTTIEAKVAVPFDQPLMREIDTTGGAILIDPIERVHAAVVGIGGAHTRSLMAASIAAGTARHGLLIVGRNDPYRTEDLDHLAELALEAAYGIAVAEHLQRMGGIIGAKVEHDEHTGEPVRYRSQPGG